MAVTKQTMTDEQRKSVALEYLKAFDNGGITSTGESILELFAPDAIPSSSVLTDENTMLAAGAQKRALPNPPIINAGNMEV